MRALARECNHLGRTLKDPGWVSLLSYTSRMGRRKRPPRSAAAGRAGPGQAAAARSAHVTSSSTAEMERRDREAGAGRRRPQPRGQAPSASQLADTLPAAPRALTCVTDDNVLEQIGVRHGRGRSVPGHTAPPPLTAPPPPRPSPRRRSTSKRQAPPTAAVAVSLRKSRAKRKPDKLTGAEGYSAPPGSVEQ